MEANVLIFFQKNQSVTLKWQADKKEAVWLFKLASDKSGLYAIKTGW